MLRVVIAPDSFKGSLSAPDVGAAIARGLARVIPALDVRLRPMADGGEGTLDAVLAAVGTSGARQAIGVCGAAGDAVAAAIGLLDDVPGGTAVVEVAQVVGITDPAGMAMAVGNRTTHGVGELMVALLDRGVRRFMIGLGGSSTNDGGSGLLAALGVRPYDSQGRMLDPTPEGLAAVARVDATDLDPRIAESEIRIMSDVNNRLTGPRGATAIFGPQKGVAPAQVAQFDDAIARYATLVEAALGRSAADKPGAGAAGGLGFALQVLGGTFASGAEVVADLVDLDTALRDAHWAITGEGRSDAQTLLAKAPFVVARKARGHGVPVTLLSGAIDPAALPLLGQHFAGCFGLPSGPATLETCIADAVGLLEDRAEQVARVFFAGHGLVK